MKLQAPEVSVVEERLFLFAAVLSLFSVDRPNKCNARQMLHMNGIDDCVRNTKFYFSLR